VAVRIRVRDGLWELALQRPGAQGTWERIDSGIGPVWDVATGRGRGSYVIDLTEPGDYAVRLRCVNRRQAM
jgi:hypothetical protein